MVAVQIFFFNVHPYLREEESNLTSIFSDGLKEPTRLFNNRKLFTDRIGIGIF